jgi:hypothetical protein
MANKQNDNIVKTAEWAFTKEKLMHSQKYSGNRDLLAVLLSEGESYTAAQVDNLINSYLIGKIKGE